LPFVFPELPLPRDGFNIDWLGNCCILSIMTPENVALQMNSLLLSSSSVRIQVNVRLGANSESPAGKAKKVLSEHRHSVFRPANLRSVASNARFYSSKSLHNLFPKSRRNPICVLRARLGNMSCTSGSGQLAVQRRRRRRSGPRPRFSKIEQQRIQRPFSHVKLLCVLLVPPPYSILLNTSRLCASHSGCQTKRQS
jgi:hypothetical protein